mmetsp:Transcript_60395/g.97868  ORF Transcript_60395/g.97868 Transcript_60395/m.97868 type:complete len:233 (-) Transcript_60395:116-814(-)
MQHSIKGEKTGVMIPFILVGVATHHLNVGSNYSFRRVRIKLAQFRRELQHVAHGWQLLPLHVWVLFFKHGNGITQLFQRLVAVTPITNAYPLGLIWLSLQRLVQLEKLLDFRLDVMGHVMDISHTQGTWFTRHYCYQLCISPLLILHIHDTDEATFRDNTWRQRKLAEHQHIYRISIWTEGPRDKAIIAWIMARGMQHSVQHQCVCLLVIFELIALVARHFDDNRHNSSLYS